MKKIKKYKFKNGGDKPEYIDKDYYYKLFVEGHNEAARKGLSYEDGYWYAKNKANNDLQYIGPTLNELVVIPSKEDKASLQAVHNNIPDKNTRNYILKLLDNYNTIDKNTQKASYRNDINQMAVKTSELYHLSGRPKIKKNSGLIAKILRYIGLDGETASGRAYMNQLSNTMYNIKTFDSFLAELSHFYNDKQIGYFNQGIPIPGLYMDSAYEKPYSLEHTTHSYTQPLLETYINSANIPEYEHINSKYINETIRNKVKEDRKQVLGFTNGGFIKIKNLNKNNMKTIKKVNQQNSIDRILFKNGGDTVPSAVGTNRSYGQVIKENVEEYLDKLKGNPFAEMLFPFEDVSKGHTEAMIPYIIPGYGVTKQSAKIVKNIFKRSTKLENYAKKVNSKQFLNDYKNNLSPYEKYINDYNKIREDDILSNETYNKPQENIFETIINKNNNKIREDNFLKDLIHFLK